jgi:hypothetical protein
MSDRPGVSKAELASAFAVLALVAATIVQLLIIRSHFIMRAETGPAIDGEATASLVRSELRRTAGAGLLRATDEAVLLRVPYAVGAVCDGNDERTVVALAPGGSGTLDTVHGAVLGWRAASGRWIAVRGRLSRTRDGAAICDAAGVERAPGAVIASVATPALAEMVGAPAVLFREVEYALRASAAEPGALALWRTAIDAGPAEELMAPIPAGTGFRYFVDEAATPSHGAPAPLTRVRGIELYLPLADPPSLSSLQAPVTRRDRAS